MYCLIRIPIRVKIRKEIRREIRKESKCKAWRRRVTSARSHQTGQKQESVCLAAFELPDIPVTRKQPRRCEAWADVTCYSRW